MFDNKKFKFLTIEGPIVHAKSFGVLEFLTNVTLKVNLLTGRIEDVNSGCNTDLSDESFHYKLPNGQFLSPGFIDTHYHAPQTVNLGLGLDHQLLEWLEQITFPQEKSYGSREPESIRHEYQETAKRLLRGGTTTCVYFGSIQVPANRLLVEAIEKVGQRALVGKVCMNQNSPADYIESTRESIDGTAEFVKFIKSLNNPLINPVVTPRFAPTCSMDLMCELGSLAKQSDCHIQTHLSENLSEIDWVHSLFPQCSSYAKVYDSAGLLGPKTILAHSIYLKEEEKTLIEQRSASVSHCPNSNFSLRSGVLNVRDLLQRGINVALGTDVSGGYSIGMLDACRQAIIASKCIHFSHPDQPSLTAAEAFSLATLNGAKALSMELDLGNFEIGKYFDAIIVDVTNHPQIPLEFNQSEPLTEPALQVLFQKFVFCGDDRCIKQVFVNGRPVDCAFKGNI